jgi:hypothetical protein
MPQTTDQFFQFRGGFRAPDPMVKQVPIHRAIRVVLAREDRAT